MEQLTLSPPAVPPIVAPLNTYYTTASGPGNSAAQTSPAKSLGGFASTTLWGGGVQGDLFGPALTGDNPDFRAIYIYNTDPTVALTGLTVYLAPDVDTDTTIAIGADPRPASFIDTLSPQAVEIASIFSAPAGVAFAAPLSAEGGIALVDLPPQAGVSLWIRRTPSLTGYTDLVFESSGGGLVRRIYWATTAGIATTQPTAPPNADSTPSPFRRVAVDFITLGGSRITWELDKTLIDPGPYIFQLQFSHSGIASETDWIDVGPPVEDACYLLDPLQRLWGSSLTTANYRVVLTTAVAAYSSNPEPLLGRLDVRSWTMAQEVLRKEKLMLRQFVGENGFLLRARRYGTLCTCVDPDTGEVGNSSCLVCYGQKYVDGFYAPVPLEFANPTNRGAVEKVEYNESMGTVRRLTIQGRVTADNVIASRDVWVNMGLDERYYIHEVKEIASFRGMPIVYEIELRAAPRGDIIYSLAITRPTDPAIAWKTPQVVVV